MTKTAWGVILSALLVPSAAWAQADAKATLEALAKDLEANGELWLADKPVDRQVEVKLKAVTYDDAMVAALPAQLAANRRPPVSLYVVNKLLQPLLMADASVIRKAVPAVKSVHQRNRQYQQFPRYTAEQLKAYKLPDVRGVGPAEAMMRQLAAVEKQQEQKVDRERPIAKYNEELYKLEKNMYELMLLSDDAKEDQLVVVAMVQNEAQGLYLYADIADLVRASAKKMSQGRAEALYKQFEAHGNRLRMVMRKYTNLGDPQVSRIDNSDHPEEQDFPGMRLLGVVNVLATTAKLPAVKVPDKKAIEEYNKKK